MGMSTPSSETFNQLRFVVSECTNDNGDVVDFRYHNWTSKLSEQSEVVFKELTWLLMRTKFFNDETKCYMRNPLLQLKGIVYTLQRENPEHKYNVNTVQTKIGRCRDKFISNFGVDIVKDIISGNKLEEYRCLIDEMATKYGKIDLLSKTALCIRQDSDAKVEKDVSDEDFEYFVETLSTYTNKVMKAVKESINMNIVAYANYIVNTDVSRLSDVDKERRETLINLFDIKENEN